MVKCRAFNALQTLEVDLETFAQIHYTYHKDLISMVHKTPLGVVKPRRGGILIKQYVLIHSLNMITKLITIYYNFYRTSNENYFFCFSL